MMKMEKTNKIKDFVLKDKFLLALLVLDLILLLISAFISALTILFIFSALITTTYLLVLFEKHNSMIFITAIALIFICAVVLYLYPKFVFFNMLLIILFFIVPQSFLLLIINLIFPLYETAYASEAEHPHYFKIEKEEKHAILKTLIIDAIILIPYLMLFGFAIPSL